MFAPFTGNTINVHRYMTYFFLFNSLSRTLIVNIVKWMNLIRILVQNILFYY